MLRLFYRCALRLHPSGFRKRFADEMLSIFDQSAARSEAFRLLVDGLVSLFRQWTLRPDFWHELSPAQQPAPDGIPSFCTLDPFRPRPGAVIHGLVLSTALFCLTCFAIRYSWIHVLHVRIPEGQSDSPRSIQANTGTAPGPSLEKPAVPTRSENRLPISSSITPRSSATSPSPAAPLPHARPNRDAAARVDQSAPVQRRQLGAGARPWVEARPAKQQHPPQSAKTSDLGSKPFPLLDRPGIVPAQPQQAKAEETTAMAAPAADGSKLDIVERQRVIRGAVATLTKYYFNPDTAQKIAAALLAHEHSGDDDAATEGEEFADLLTRQMMNVSHDPYVMMVYSPVPSLENPPAPTPEEVARYRREMERNNCTFQAVKILPHNIGYLKFNEFPDASICRSKVAAAMTSLNRADAIIFDLRDNRGGYADMVALIATYLFDHPTHLNDFYNRSEDSIEQSWTLPPVPGNRLADKPAFVLTSRTTFSAAEAFSYDLKMLDRATLVGETTSGRGHMGMGHRIDDYFTIRVPGISVVNPISKTNWEGTGVEPDVKVKAADALRTAENLAQKKLQRN